MVGAVVRENKLYLVYQSVGILKSSRITAELVCITLALPRDCHVKRRSRFPRNTHFVRGVRRRKRGSAEDTFSLIEF